MRDVASEIQRIGELTRDGLVDAWIKTHKRPPPKGISRRILEYDAAYNIQVRAYGGLSKASNLRLLREARKDPAKPGVSTRHLQPKSGSRLIREWHGTSYTVDVTETGFVHAGRTYPSLSEVARVITGARWSGRRFFGT